MDKKQVWKKILIGAMIPIICVIVWFAFARKEVETYAKHTLPGIETIAVNNGSFDPYVILEVVDSKDDAALGYLVGGEEPIKNGKSIRDIPTEAERTALFPTILDDMIPADYDNLEGNAFTSSLITTTGAKSVDIVGQYISATNGSYDLAETPASYIPYDSGVHLTEQRYDLYAAFYQDAPGSFVPTFTQIETSIPDIIVDGITYRNYFKFEIDAANAAVVLASDTDFSSYNGKEVFDSSLSGYVYKGRIVTQSEVGHPDAYVLGPNGELYLFGNAADYSGVTLDGKNYVDIPAASGSYQMISFTSNPAAGTHYISAFSKATVDNQTTYRYEEVWNPVDDGGYVIGTEASEEYVYDPAGNGTLNWQTDYSGGTYATYSYDGGFVNNEWMKKNVFDREDAEIEPFVLDVRTVTMEELNSYDLDTVDMVYFADIDGGYPIDITDAQAIALFTKLVDQNLPILMNRTAYDYVHNNAATFPNMDKLVMLFAQTSYESYSGAKVLANWTDSAFVDALPDTLRTPHATYGFNFINQAFYMYDDTNYAGIGAVPFVNVDFLTAFSDEMTTDLYQVVIDEIEAENFYIQIAGYSDTMPVEATKASVLRHIINYGYKRNLIKSNISVLEIEPCYSYKYSDYDLGTVNTLREAASDVYNNTGRTTYYNVVVDRHLLSTSYIANNWATQFKNNEDDITLTQTYTGEFIGKIEDLNETYDLIYIGLDTSTMNTRLDKVSGQYHKSDYTLYNNDDLNGLIYVHSGDYLTMTESYVLRGLLNPNDVGQENYMDGYGKYALSGNDITLEKYNALCEYMDAGYPIVFADGFFNLDSAGMATSVNVAKVDKASYMYRVAQYALDKGYFGNNVNIDSNIKNDSTGTGAKEKLADHLNISKLQITMTSIPTVYDGTATSPAYLPETNGKYLLQYQFILKDDSAVIGGDTNYNIQLYIDSSVDGRYYSDEEITDLLVYELKNGSYEQIYHNSAGKYEMSAGKYYKVVREVPTGYVGVLPWKLVLTRNDNALVRKSEIGYTAIQTPSSSRETIKVLQLLASTDYVSNNWNLQTDSSFNSLLDQVQDFDIQITSVPVASYIGSGSEANASMHYDYLDDYNMVVIGFSDGYSFSAKNITPESKRDNLTANAALAIRQYISEGRSVLFTHDTTSYCNTTDFKDTWRSDGSYRYDDPNQGAWLWGYEFNHYVRDVVGMDRYGVLRKVDGLTPVNTIYDTMWKSGTLQTDNNTLPYTQGYNNQTIVDYASSGDYVYTTRPGVAGHGGQYSGEMYVTETNEGQITKYPFDIPDEFQVQNTHRQYYQLNMDTDSKDNIKDDDIVVWYCISDVRNKTDIYETCPNDVRNNYYIYNKGNVTYSGVGHSRVQAQYETEMKLFVNTMVAAYNAGVHPPKVTYKDGSAEDASVIEYLYLPYDEALGQYIDTTAEIYFDIADTSFMQGTKKITAYYYLEVDSSVSGAQMVSIDGETRYLKEFIPNSMTNVRTGEVLTGDNVHNMVNDSKYHFTISPTEMALLTENRANIYVAAKTTYTRSSGSGAVVVSETPFGYYEVSVLKAQLFDME